MLVMLGGQQKVHNPRSKPNTAGNAREHRHAAAVAVADAVSRAKGCGSRVFRVT
jgi:hypothetical protein